MRRTCDPGQFSFKSTSELTELAGIIGQEWATKATDFGVEIPDEGIAMLTERAAGERREDGTYPQDSATYFVNQQLQEFTTKLERFGKKEQGARAGDESYSPLAIRPCTCTL